jgi:hypothetical protein
MTTDHSISRATPAQRMQLFFWLHPEWWTVALCGVAWLAMLQHGWQHAGHGALHRMSFPQELVSWLLMVAAMMLPLVVDSVRATADASLWARRHRAIAGFVVGYLAPWAAVGVVAVGVRQLSWIHTHAAPALVFGMAALWLLTPMHRRGLVACHRRRPLAPLGWRADRDCLAFGGTIGRACVSSCWPLMLACALTGHALVAMIGGMGVSLIERWSFRPRIRAAALGALALAIYFGVQAGWDSGVSTKVPHSVELHEPPILCTGSVAE